MRRQSERLLQCRQRDDHARPTRGADGAGGADARPRRGTADQPELDGVDRQRGRDGLPGRTLSGRGLLDLHADWRRPPRTPFSNTGLAGDASYSYRVRATDAAANLSGYSTGRLAATTPAPRDRVRAGQRRRFRRRRRRRSDALHAAQTAGNLNVVVVGWNSATAQVLSVTDTRGNRVHAAVGPTVAGFGTQASTTRRTFCRRLRTPIR